MKTIKLLSILVITALVQSCTKETNCGDSSDIVNNYNISADNKSKIPFKGNDTLIYISDAGDTAVLVGIGKKETIQVQSISISNNADCPKSEVSKSEVIEINYWGFSEINKIKFKEYATKNGNSSDYSINSFNYINAYPGFLNNTNLYSDSIVIKNKAYYGIPFETKDNIKFIYNYNYGFLKIQIGGGKIWLLRIS